MAGQTDMMALMDAFHNFVNTPRKSEVFPQQQAMKVQIGVGG